MTIVQSVSRTLFLLLLVHLESMHCSYNYTRKCFLNEDDSAVMWNVTFNGDNAPDLNDTNIVMQTKGPDDNNDAWVTLHPCKRNTFSISCQIDSNQIRFKYLLRIVKVVNSTYSTDVMHEGDDRHFQDGLLCHHNHAKENDFVWNLTVSNVKSNSFNFSWNFYRWDIKKYHLWWVHVRLYNKERQVITNHKLHVDERKVITVYKIEVTTKIL